MKKPLKVNHIEELSNPKSGFHPLNAQDGVILIVGTFPGKESRDNNEYYFAKRNRFWDIIGSIYSIDQLKYQTYDRKKEVLFKHKICLWDLINYAETSGSQDKDIEKALYNSFDSFLDYRDQIKCLVFNGIYTGNLAKEEVPEIFKRKIVTKSLQSTSGGNGKFNNGEDWKKFFSSIG
jgi:hypoxanthine-DNA glycosylase